MYRIIHQDFRRYRRGGRRQTKPGIARKESAVLK